PCGVLVAACFGVAPHCAGVPPEARQSGVFSSGRGVPRISNNCGPASTISCQRSGAPSEILSVSSDLIIRVPGVTTRSTSLLSSQSMQLSCHALHALDTGFALLTPHAH